MSAISKPRNPIIARLFRWAKLAENAGFGIDKMLVWKNKVEFDTKIVKLKAQGLLERVDPDKGGHWRVVK